MWTKPWTMKEGFLIGGCVILVGLILQLSAGPMVWKALAWPVNGIMLAGFLFIIAGMHLKRKKGYFFQFIGTYQAAIPILVYAVLLTIIMGLTRQSEQGTWLNNMLTFWPFVLIYVIMALILGVTVLRRLTMIRRERIVKDIAFLLNHCGLFIAMTASTLGNADVQQLKMITVVGEPEWRALTQDGFVREMPMTIELKKFIMETYDDGMPKRYASEIQISSRPSSNTHHPSSHTTIVEVNNPVEANGWKIYQYGYDTQMGAMSQTSILELVNDPWLPLVYSGIYMMLAGVLLLLIYTRWSYKRLLPMAALIVVALAIVSYFIPIFRSTKLVPALQSPWFTPHILVYIICYSLMGVAAVTAIWTLAVSYLPKTKSQKPNTDSQKPKATLDNLVYVGLIFMTFGMMFGAFWAKEAWGHYWSWDPKETWAAITWFSYLIYIHYRQLPRQNSRLALWLLILSFILLQMCWWGINYLPSAQGISIHTYN